METEVAIIGGSFAGLAAAMQLVRGRRKVVVIDAGKPRNRFSLHSHGVFALDGKSPAQIKATALSQLADYPTFTFLEGEALNVEKESNGGFRLHLSNTNSINAKKLILASGVQDELPDIPGLAEHWGKTVVHCPYCHGYELADRKLGVIATGAMSAHQAAMIPDWGPTTLFTQGALVLDDEQHTLLAKRGVKIERIPVSRVNGDGEKVTSVHLTDGSQRAIQGIYVAPRLRIATPLVEQLGCELEASPLGEIIKVNDFKETSVAHVYAAGDISNPGQSATLAIASGTMAGLGLHRSLMFD